MSIENRIPNNENELDLSIDTDNDEFLGIDDEIAKEILADIDKEETEAIARVSFSLIFNSEKIIEKGEKSSKEIKKGEERTG